MSPETESEVHALHARIARLERASSKPRGYTDMNGAAAYIHKSREWLRQKHARGEGPPCLMDGRFRRYTFDELDRYMEALADAD